MIRILGYISLGLFSLWLIGCASRMPSLERTGIYPSLEEWTPRKERQLYRGFVDLNFGLKKSHISGLLLLHPGEGGNWRFVFQNAMGMVYFDGEEMVTGQFRILRIRQEMDRPMIRQWIEESLEFWLMPGQGTPGGRRGGEERNHPAGDSVWLQRVIRPPYVLDYRLHAGQMEALTVWKKGRENRTMVWTYSPEAAPHALASTVLIQDRHQRIQVELKRMEEHVAQ